MRDAVLNLLLNACAASPEGATVTFIAEQIGDGLHINVGDRGSGMPEAYRAFPGAIGGAATDRSRPGAGLGLWMVRRLLDETGASVSVDATADRHHHPPELPTHDGGCPACCLKAEPSR